MKDISIIEIDGQKFSITYLGSKSNIMIHRFNYFFMFNINNLDSLYYDQNGELKYYNLYRKAVEKYKKLEFLI